MCNGIADVGCLLLQERMKMQERVFSTEAVMLRAFGFVLHVEHPHKFVLSLLLLLGLDGPILQEAWNLTNDRSAPAHASPCCDTHTAHVGKQARAGCAQPFACVVLDWV